MSNPPTGVRSFYRHCGEEWEAEWDSACDDECPVCGYAVTPYDWEDEADVLVL